MVVTYYTFFPMRILLDNCINNTVNLIPIKQTIDMIRTNGIHKMIYNVLGNILLFMPLGFLIPLTYKKGGNLKKVILIGFLISLTVECGQYFLALRRTDIDDVITNTLGTIVGFLTYKLIKCIVQKTVLNNLIEKYQDKDNKWLILTALKPLSAIIILSIGLIFGIIYLNTYPSNLPSEKIVVQCLNYKRNSVVLTKDFDDCKFIITSNSKNGNEAVEVESFRKIFGNRFYYDGSPLLFLKNNKNGYAFSTKYKSKDSKIYYIYGKNSIASKVTITYNNKKYTEDISSFSYFVVVYPFSVDITSDVKNIVVNFFDKNGHNVTNKIYRDG